MVRATGFAPAQSGSQPESSGELKVQSAECEPDEASESARPNQRIRTVRD
jgi:hypothetical protein